MRRLATMAAASHALRLGLAALLAREKLAVDLGVLFCDLHG